jgi:hypothetical protein
MKRVDDPCRSALLYPLSFPPHLRRFPVLSYFRPSPEDSVLYNFTLQSRAAVKATRLYEPPRHAYMHAHVARTRTREGTKVCSRFALLACRDDALAARKISLSLQRRCARQSSAHLVRAGTNSSETSRFGRLVTQSNSRSKKNTLSPFCSGKLDRQVRRRIRRTRRGKFRVSAQ